MPERGAYGHRLGQSFGLDHAPAFVTRSLRGTTIAVTELKLDIARGLTEPIAKEDAFLVALQMREYPIHELWLDGKSIKAGPFAAGATAIYDLTRDPIAHIEHQAHPVFFYCRGLPWT